MALCRLCPERAGHASAGRRGRSRAGPARSTASAARRLAAAAGGERVASSSPRSAKCALYPDASPRAQGADPWRGGHALRRCGARGGSRAAGDGRALRRSAGADTELARLDAIGMSGVPLVCAVQRRLLLLAELRGQVEQGSSIGAVLGSPGGSVYPREQEAVGRAAPPLDRAPRRHRAASASPAGGRAPPCPRGPGELAHRRRNWASSRAMPRVRDNRLKSKG